jgi:hypothetical protein
MHRSWMTCNLACGGFGWPVWPRWQRSVLQASRRQTTTRGGRQPLGSRRRAEVRRGDGPIPGAALRARRQADLTSYVVEKGMDGIFHYLAQQEAAIRTDPAARTTELLQKVFGAR